MRNSKNTVASYCRLHAIYDFESQETPAATSSNLLFLLYYRACGFDRKKPSYWYSKLDDTRATLYFVLIIIDLLFVSSNCNSITVFPVIEAGSPVQAKSPIKARV